MEEDNTGAGFDHHDQNQNHHQDPNSNNNYGASDQTQYYHQDQAHPQDQQAQPAQQPAVGPTQVSSQSAQISFTYQNNAAPGRPNRPVQYHQQQPNPVYMNPVHRPNQETYNNNLGTPPKAGGGGYYQPPGSPMKLSTDNNYQYGGQGGGGYNNNINTGGPMPGYVNQPGPGPGRPANGFPVQPSPHGMIVPDVGTEPWRSGLFDCMNDPSNALITALCPCITFGQVAEIIDKGNSTCATSGLIYGLLYSFALPCILSAGYRTKVRNMYGLTETPAPDFLTHALCEWCAVCQLYRELRDRGLDPSMGWQGNVAKMNLEALQRNNQVQMTPPMHERMMP